MSERPCLSHAELLQLRRLTTPTVFNGWEQITRHDPAADGFNLEPVTDFMPQFGPMVGYAVTAVIGMSDDSVLSDKTLNAWGEFRKYDHPYIQKFSKQFWHGSMEYFGVAQRYLRPPVESYTDAQMKELKPFFDGQGLDPGAYAS